MSMRRRVIIISVVIVIVIVILVVAFLKISVTPSGLVSDSNDDNNVESSNAVSELFPQRSEPSSSSAPLVPRDSSGDSEGDSEASASGGASESDSGERAGSVGRVPHGDAALDKVEGSMDQDLAKSHARDFAQAFFEYDADSLSCLSYKRSFVGLVSSRALDPGFSTSQNGSIYQHSLDSWSVNLGTYKEAYSHVESISVGDAFASPVIHRGDYAVRMTMVLDRNTDDTASGVDWFIVDRFRKTIVVFMDSDYKVDDVRQESSDVLEFNIFNQESREQGSI